MGASGGGRPTCAKRISTLFLSSRDLPNSGVRMMARVMSRASSLTARAPSTRACVDSISTLAGKQRIEITDAEFGDLQRRLQSDPDPEKQPIDFTKRMLYRPFNNGSFEEGGRFYGGWWQSVPKEFRPSITIRQADC